MQCPKDKCPSWWVCPTRGCYEEAKERYADYRPDKPWPGDWYVAEDGRSYEKGSGYHGTGLRWKK